MKTSVQHSVVHCAETIIYFFLVNLLPSINKRVIIKIVIKTLLLVLLHIITSIDAKQFYI